MDAIKEPIMYMILKSSMFYEKKELVETLLSASSGVQDTKEKINLIEYHFGLMNHRFEDEEFYDNLPYVMYLLEEQAIYGCPFKHDFFIELFKKYLMEGDENCGNEKEKLHFNHSILGLMMIYWNCFVDYKICETKSFEVSVSTESKVIHSQRLERKFLFFEILSSILKKDKNIVNDLHEKFGKMQYRFKKDYNLRNRSNSHEKYASNFAFIFLYAAIKTNQDDVARKVFECCNFNNAIPVFPVNMKVGEIHREVALMFLENRYELGRAVLPKNWITKENLKTFLDSRISQQDRFFKIDCRFMLPFYNYGEPTAVKKKLDDDCYMNEDYDTMEYIAEDHDLKELMSHPVMELITKLKFKKYHKILILNVIMFLMLYMAPLMTLLYAINFNENDDWLIVCSVVLSFGLAYTITREIFQFFFVYKKNFGKYFGDEGNLAEIGLIAFTIILIGSAINGQSIYVLLPLEIINIILAIIVTAVSLPALKFAIFMKIVGNVFKTYLNIFVIFLPFTLGSIAFLFTIFGKNFSEDLKKVNKMRGAGNETTTEENLTDFYEIETGFMKYMIMFSGEIGIEPKHIFSIIQTIGLALILILIVNHSNLLISITINNVNDEIESSKLKNLQLNARKYVTFAKILRVFYARNIE